MLVSGVGIWTHAVGCYRTEAAEGAKGEEEKRKTGENGKAERYAFPPGLVFRAESQYTNKLIPQQHPSMLRNNVACSSPTVPSAPVR